MMPLDATITPAQQIPWPVSSPFAMQPGLQRQPPNLFVYDALASAYRQQKAAMLEPRLSLAPPSTSAPMLYYGKVEKAVLESIANAFTAQTQQTIPATDPMSLALAMQEDFVVLQDQVLTPSADSTNTKPPMRVAFLSVAFPSNWVPQEKLGLDFRAIHAPVADNTLLQQGADAIVDSAFRKQSMLRHVWLLSPDGNLSQHPHLRKWRWHDALYAAQATHTPLINRIYFRVERQTTLPLPQLGVGVFFIRVMVGRLAEVLEIEPQRRSELAAALASMSPAVVRYRGMEAALPTLLQELTDMGAKAH